MNEPTAACPSSSPPTAEHQALAESQVQASGTVDFTADHPAKSAAPLSSPPCAIPGYETLGVLGQGGMGVVYKARQVRLKRLVALKMILRGAQARREDIERFRLEAEAVARLQHPNIVQIHEVGEHEGMPYFSLELVDGGNLQQKLAGTPLAAQEAAPLVETLARAMHAAHQQGIIHRDLKPINVLLTRDSVPKIADFGLAKQVESDSGQTHTGQILGTPSYMAPEQAAGDGKAVGPAADTYALGAILYEALTGRPPFKGARMLDTLQQVRTQEPVAPRQLQPEVPRDLETICLKCLQKDPSRRYASAQELADDLSRFQKGEPIRARPVGAGERLSRWCRRNPLVAALAGALFTVLVTGLVLVSWKWQEALDHAGREATARVQAQTAEAGARAAEARSREERRKTQRQLALSRLEQGLALCQRHDVHQGLFVMAGALPDALQSADRDLEWSIRTQVQEWALSLLPLRAVIPDPANGDSVCFVDEERAMLSVSKDGMLQRWDTATGAAAGPAQKIPAGRLQFTAFSPDGKFIYLQAFLRHPRLWDVAARRFVGKPLDHLLHTRPMAFSPDGKWLVTCRLTGPSAPKTEHAQVWSVPSGETLGPPLPHSSAITALAASSDGKLLLTGCSDGTARLWEVPSGKLVGGPFRHGGDIRHVGFHRDGKLLTAGKGSSVSLWDPKTGKSAGVLAGNESADLLYAVASGHGRFLTGGNKGEGRLWGAVKKGGKSTVYSRALMHGNGAAIASVAFSPDGDTAITGASYHWSSRGETRRWDGVNARPLGPPLPHRGQVRAVSYSPSGEFILVEGTEEARLWLALPQKSKGRPFRHDATVFGGSFSPDGRAFLTVSGSIVRLWSTETGEALTSFSHDELLKTAKFSPDGKTVLTAGFTKNEVRLWDAASGQPRGDPLTHADLVVALACSPDGKTLLTTCADRTVRLWDTATGKGLGDPIALPQNMWAAEFAPDGRTLLLGGPDKGATKGEARSWDLETRQFHGPVLAHPAPVHQITFSHDGRTVLTVCQGTTTDAYQVRLWDARTWQPLGARLVHQGKISQAVFSPDDRTIATASQDLTARLWDAATGQPVGAVLQHPAPVLSAAFSSDGRRLLTAASDGVVRQWETRSSRLLGAPIMHRGAFALLALHPDGKLLLTGGADQTARLWHFPSPLERNPEHLTAWLQVLTGSELDEHGAVQLLDSAAWQERRQRLEQSGGFKPR